MLSEQLSNCLIVFTVTSCSSDSYTVGAPQADGPFSTLVQHLHTVDFLPLLFHATRP